MERSLRILLTMQKSVAFERDQHSYKGSQDMLVAVNFVLLHSQQTQH